MKTITNLFFVYSPLHYISSKRIVELYENKNINNLYYLRKSCRGYINDEFVWSKVKYLPWARFDPLPGFWGVTKRYSENLDIVLSDCQNSNVINLHTPVLDIEAVNYFINYLKIMLPGVSISVRIIPDGMLNLSLQKIPLYKKLSFYLRSFRKFIAPKLNYYIFKGDRTGSDDPIVDVIYVLSGFPHPYNNLKVIELPLVNSGTEEKSDRAPISSALVVGQDLVGCLQMSREDMVDITHRIYELLNSSGVKHIAYKPHPRDNSNEFCHPHYNVISLNETMEEHLIRSSYDVVIGVNSTVLLTARLILPKECRIVSLGMSKVRCKSQEVKESVYSAFKLLDVEVID